MRMSLKLNCNRCLAGRNHVCDLKYETKIFAKDKHGFVGFFMEPQEPCPKPLKVNDYIFALNHYKNTKLPYLNQRRKQL